jgi:hypothetical protein
MLRFMGLPGTSDPYVTIRIFDARTVAVLEAADRWSQMAHLIVDVNAIDNGKHGPTTLHGRSLAWDLDVEGDLPTDLALLGAYLTAALPAPYQVIVETTHVHVEWDERSVRHA